MPFPSRPKLGDTHREGANLYVFAPSVFAGGALCWVRQDRPLPTYVISRDGVEQLVTQDKQEALDFSGDETIEKEIVHFPEGWTVFDCGESPNYLERALKLGCKWIALTDVGSVWTIERRG